MGPEKAARCGATTEANRPGSQHKNCRQKAEEVDTQSWRGVGRGATDLPPPPHTRPAVVAAGPTEHRVVRAARQEAGDKAAGGGK